MVGELASKAARMTCVGFDGPELNSDLEKLLDLGVGGVLLYGTRDEGPEHVAALIDAIKRHAARPLFVAVDQEGGDFTRLRDGFTPLPPLRALGNTGSSELAARLGRLIGEELRAVGADVCLGPVLDVDTNPDNPIIGERSLGRDASLVARLGTALAKGLQASGVAASGKHFPGHGDTSQDSNTSLPCLPHDVTRLESVELPPFAAAVEARLAAIVAAHVIFSPLDRTRPASLSRPVLYGLLRAKLGYRGVVLCDDVDMAAVAEHFGPERVATYGVNASVDCFVCARRPESAYEIVEAIVKGVESQVVLPERVEAANRRLTALLHRYARPANAAPDLSRVGCSEHRRLVERILARGSEPPP
jgi:beta-N-acetylhexosaminidase